MTRVSFVLPGASPVPSGGAKMVFRYASALAADGWIVTVIMPASLKSASLWRRVLCRGKYWVWNLTGGYSPQAWIVLHEKVRLLWVPDLDARRAVDGEVVIATAVQTAEAIAGWPASAGRKYYFVQGYETWDFSPARVTSSWRLPLKKIAISRWLCDLVAATGEPVSYLPNGLDHEAFGLDCPPESRRKLNLLWPHSNLRGKGSADVLALLKGLGPIRADLEISAFGTSAAPETGDLQIIYHRNPSQESLRKIYNRTTVMVSPSHSEGWGLPACEALQCGCALAASDIGGHREFLVHEHNSLLHPPGHIASLRENIVRLLTDQALRLRLAQQGVDDMASFRFAPAVGKLKRLLAE